MNDFAELKREGLSIQAISSVTGFDRKTVRKYLLKPDVNPAYGPRPSAAGKLDAFKPYLEERLKAGVWNAAVLLRELKARSYTGGYGRNKYKSTGVIKWMLNNVWPSLAWHLYDYHLEARSGYYGTKKSPRAAARTVFLRRQIGHRGQQHTQPVHGRDGPRGCD